MKQQIFILLFSVLFTFSHFCVAQENSEAVLIEEFNSIYCDDFLARVDYFFIELQSDPQSIGYAVIAGKVDEIFKKVRFEMWLDGAIRFRNFDADKIKTIRSEDTESFRIQFWKVPVGAKTPSFNGTSWNFTLPQKKSKPFIFHSNSINFEAICSNIGYERIFSEFILANPKSRGHIVIFENSFKAFLKVKEQFLKNLPGLPEDRLKFFHVRQKESLFELWIVPNN